MYGALLTLTSRSKHVSKCLSQLLLVCGVDFKSCVRLSIAGVKLAIPQAHGVCFSMKWVTRTPWHNTHFNCLLLFIYRMCFIDIITGSSGPKSQRLYVFFSSCFAVWCSGEASGFSSTWDANWKVSWGIWPCLTLLENLAVSCFSGSHIEADYMGCMSAYLWSGG